MVCSGCKLDLQKDTVAGRIDIYIDFKKGYKFLDKQGQETTAYDTEEKTWRHLNFFQHECYLHARVPRIKTEGIGINLVQVPWSREGSGFTLLFEGLSVLMIESEMPVSKAANLLNIYDTRLWRILKYWVNKSLESESCKDTVSIGIDETSTVYTDESLPGLPSKASHIFLAKNQSTKLMFFSLVANIYLFFSQIYISINLNKSDACIGFEM